MGRINVNQAINESEKIESLPSKMGTTKSNLKEFGGPLKSAWDAKRHHRGYRSIAYRIMKRSIGKNWDTVVKAIRESMPEGIIEKYPWYIDRPDVMIQNSVTGYYHWQDYKGRLSYYGYESPKALKHGTSNEQYYLDNQNRLKLIKGRLKYHRIAKTKNEIQHEDKEREIEKYLYSIADYSRKLQKKYDWYKSNGDKHVYHDNTISFTHPTKVRPKTVFDKETKKWVNSETEFEPCNITLSVDQFILWCKTNNKTYYIEVDHKILTNLKWSLKQ